MVCKLATAAQTKFGTVDQYVGIRCAAVYGLVFSKWDKRDKRESLLGVGDSTRGLITGNNRLMYALSTHKVKMQNKIRRDGGFSYGTTNWFKVDATSSMENYGAISPDSIQLDNKYVFSQFDTIYHYFHFRQLLRLQEFF